MKEMIEVAEQPHKLHEALLHMAAMSKRSLVMMGKLLYHLKKGQKFKLAIGAGVDTWEDYLKQPEIGLSSSEANRLIQVYETMVLRLGYDEETISQIPAKNLHYLLPLVKKMKNKEQSDELVADATLLSQKDFKERIWDAKAAEIGEGAIRTYEYLVMRKILETGTMDKVMDIDSETIKRTFNLE